MGRVIIEFKDGHKESFRCKSSERAAIIAGKRLKAKVWNYYGDNDRIPSFKKINTRPPMPASFEELDMLMRKQGLIH